MLDQAEADDLWQYIRDIPVAMLTTFAEGKLRARPMHNVQKEFVGKLWFFTDIGSAKAGEISRCREVCLTYEDTHKQLYISASGTARTTCDTALVEKLWNPMVAAWFPKGKEDQRIGLIEVEVQQAELWEAQANRVTQLLKIATATARNHKPDIGAHRQYPRH